MHNKSCTGQRKAFKFTIGFALKHHRIIIAQFATQILNSPINSFNDIISDFIKRRYDTRWNAKEKKYKAVEWRKKSNTQKAQSFVIRLDK